MNWIQNTVLFFHSHGDRFRLLKNIQKLIASNTPATLIFIFSISAFNISGQVPLINHEVCTNFVRIEGSSNVNKFYFEQNISNRHHGEGEYHESAEYIKIELPVKYFEASNPRMRNDFFDLIKANDYPYISIFIQLPDDEAKASLDREVTSTIKVKLAGHEKEYHLPGKIHICQNNSLRLQGSLELDINDFNLTPPTKFLGMVKVNREVFIKFGLIINNDLLTKGY